MGEGTIGEPLLGKGSLAEIFCMQRVRYSSGHVDTNCPGMHSRKDFFAMQRIHFLFFCHFCYRCAMMKSAFYTSEIRGADVPMRINKFQPGLSLSNISVRFS